MYSKRLKELTIDCKKCSGLCCVALFCSKMDGFPEDKQADVPCKYLQTDFKCEIHTQLSKKNMKGCLTYECFGAGQKVTQLYSSEGNWSTNPYKRKEIYKMFLIITQLHQMSWYLIEAIQLNLSPEFNKEILVLIQENEDIVKQEASELLKYDLSDYRERTNQVLKRVCEEISKIPNEKNKVFFGKNFKGKNLDKNDFSMSLMIAANLENCSLKRTNFLGADLRDTNIKNTDLSEALFLTQMQINSAKGNTATKLPCGLVRPSNWK